MTAATPAGSARTARAERSRAAIADAALELVRDGDPRPTAARVAERAGISERLIYHHFSDLEELFHVVAERQLAQVRARTPELPSDGPLEARIRAIVDARADVNEWITPVRRASVAREPSSSALRANRARAGDGARQQVARVFATELAARPTADAAELLAALDLALSWPAWDALRARGATVDLARRTVERTVRALLAP
jgi:AcrR family transcriptional regulator